MNRMLLLALVAISLIKTSQCVSATPGQPVPHAEVLHDLLTKFLGDSYSNNDLFDFILGKSRHDRDNLTGDNLDISILDVKNVQKIIAFAKRKHKNVIMLAENTRRDHDPNVAPYGSYTTYPETETYAWHPYVVNKTLELMKQTIYMTNEKINCTRPFRQKYGNQPGYQIALLYGASAALLTKMEALYSQMKHFYYRTHFIWFLIIYEKMLACSVDINDSIEKLFLVQKQHELNRGMKLKDALNMKLMNKKGNKSQITDNEMMMELG